MKHKQKPVILVSILVVALIGIGLTNSTDIWTKVFAERKEMPKNDGATGEKVTDKEKAALAESVKGRRGKAMAEGPEGEETVTSIPDHPSILVPKQTYIKQTQNEAAVSQQWYRDESSTEARKKALEEKRGG